jgi:hypothetical protein
MIGCVVSGTWDAAGEITGQPKRCGDPSRIGMPSRSIPPKAGKSGGRLGSLSGANQHEAVSAAWNRRCPGGLQGQILSSSVSGFPQTAGNGSQSWGSAERTYRRAGDPMWNRCQDRCVRRTRWFRHHHGMHRINAWFGRFVRDHHGMHRIDNGDATAGERKSRHIIKSWSELTARTHGMALPRYKGAN